jgi:subtilisin family serine protease
MELENLGATLVTAAGNFGATRLYDTKSPGALSQLLSGLINVGGVDADRTRSLIIPRCDPLDSTDTCLTAYAQGTQVWHVTPGGNYAQNFGTSLSAEQVSGLAAYILTHPSPDVQLAISPALLSLVGTAVSVLIKTWSFQKGPTLATSSNVVWNGVLMNLCRAGLPQQPPQQAKRAPIQGNPDRIAKLQAAAVFTSVL